MRQHPLLAVACWFETADQAAKSMSGSSTSSLSQDPQRFAKERIKARAGEVSRPGKRENKRVSDVQYCRPGVPAISINTVTTEKAASLQLQAFCLLHVASECVPSSICKSSYLLLSNTELSCLMERCFSTQSSLQ